MFPRLLLIVVGCSMLSWGVISAQSITIPLVHVITTSACGSGWTEVPSVGLYAWSHSEGVIARASTEQINAAYTRADGTIDSDARTAMMAAAESYRECRWTPLSVSE